MKKRYVFIHTLAAVLIVTNLLSLIIIKEQSNKLTIYNESFFMSAYNLIENYQKTLDLEKKYISETDDVEKEKMLGIFNELVPLISRHSGSVRSMLSTQVPVNEFVVLESAVYKEVFLFDHAASDSERNEHLENLEVALKKFKSFIDEQMKKQEICVFDSCK